MIIVCVEMMFSLAFCEYSAIIRVLIGGLVIAITKPDKMSGVARFLSGF